MISKRSVRIERSGLSRELLLCRFSYDDIGGGLYYRPGFPGVAAGSRAGSVHQDKEYDYAARVVKVNGVYFRESHLVWMYHTGNLPADQLDHINGDPLDNRIENLRECSKAENQQNRRLSRDNTSGLLGVWPSPNGRWDSSISVSGKVVNLGRFDTAEAAHNAYLTAKAKYHKFNPVPREVARATHIS